MKKIMFVVAIAMLGSPICSFAQSAPLGKELVKEFSEKIKSYETIKTAFSFTLQNLPDEISDTYEGTLSYKGKQYILSLMGMEVFYDGETKWQYIPDANEVTISKPSSLDGGLFDDPTKIFNDYEQNFSSRFIGQQVEKGVNIYEVELYPEDLSEPYSLIKIRFNKQNLDPISIKYQGKDGINYIIEVKSFKTNVALKNDFFTFDVSKHKGIEIVDLR